MLRRLIACTARPTLPSEVASYAEHQMGRLDGKPGLTGLWQISGRADIPFELQADMDIAYVKARSGLAYLLILLLTPLAVWKGRGAY